jgi:hypothetical protein
LFKASHFLVNNELTPKQQTSEAIRQAETILITTGQHPTVDQAAAVLALSAILRKFGKKVSAIISDQLPQPAQFLDASNIDKNLSGLRDFILKVDVAKTEVDKLRYEVEGTKLNVYITPFKGGFAPSDVTFGYGDYHFDIVIVLGVAQRARLDRVLLDNPGLITATPVINIDFHRTNESYGAVNLIEPTASSLCEILVALSESLQSGLIDSDIATVMLAGLMASTDRFTAVHTTSKSLTVAAQLMAAGAKQQQVVKGLYQGGGQRFDRGTDRPRSEQTRSDQPRQERSNERRPEQPARPAAASAPERQPEPVRNEQPRTDRAEQPRAEETRREAEAQSVTPTLERAPERPDARPSAAGRPANPDAERTDPPETEDVDTLLQPDHIEPEHFEPGDEAPRPSQPTQPQADDAMTPMADFAAAAEILRQRQEQAAHSEAEGAERPSRA